MGDFSLDKNIYVIVLNGRENDYIDRKALHWLDTVNSFAPASPVILVVNKSDKKPYTTLRESVLHEKYATIYGRYIHTSAQEGLGIADLSTAITDCAMESDGYLHTFNANMKTIKEHLETMEAYYIQRDAYSKICRDAGIDNPVVQLDLLNWFKILGVSFYYEDKPGKEARPSMKQYTVLKPEWLTNGIYRLINRSEERNGIISHEAIQQVLAQVHPNDVIPNLLYSEQETEYILYVMRLFRLSYKFENSTDEDYEFIPLKCAKDMPESTKQYKQDPSLHLSWENEFIPYNVLYRVMVNMFQEIDLVNTWRYGAVFHTDSATSLLIEMDIYEKRIDVYVKSKSFDAKEQLSRYRSAILEALKNLNIETKEYLYYEPGDGRIGKIEYATVLWRYKDRKETVSFNDLQMDVNTVRLLNLFYIQKDIEQSIVNQLKYYPCDSNRSKESFMPFDLLGAIKEQATSYIYIKNMSGDLNVNKSNVNVKASGRSTMQVTTHQTQSNDHIESSVTGEGIIANIGKDILQENATTNVQKGESSKIDIDAIARQFLEALNNSDEGAKTRENLKNLMLEAQAKVTKDPKEWGFWKGKLAAAAQFTSIGAFVLKLLGVVP